MKYTEYLKNTEAYSVISSDIENGSLSHSYLLLTEDDLLRGEALTLFAMAVFDHGKACGNCVTCRRILNNTAIDYICLDKQNIGVDDIKTILDDVNLSSMEGQYKVYCIPNFDKANAQSQNKMLKTLEEPLDKVIFLLGAAKETGVLPTVRSRCAKLRLPPIPTKTLMKMLAVDNSDQKLTEIAAASADGSITKALETLQNGLSLQITDELFELLDSIKTTRDIPDYLNYPAFEKENLPVATDLLISIFRDIMINHTTSDKESLSFPLHTASIDALSEKFPRSACILIIDELMECKKKIRFNCNEKNIADSLLQKILEVRYKCLL